MKPRPPLHNEALLEAPIGGTAPPIAPPAPPAAPDPTPAPSWFNPDGTFGENWQSALGDDFAPHAASLAPFKDIKGLAKSYLHFRANGPAYPEGNTAPEDVARFRAIAKVPETPEGYGITPPTDLPEGITFDDALAKDFAKIAHDHHVPAPALKALIAKQLEVEVSRHTAFQEAQQAERKAAQDALVGEWGGKYQENASIVRHHAGRLAEAAGIPADSPALAQLANTPEFNRLMIQVAKLTAEDHIRTPAGFGDLRSAAERAESIMNGSDPTWGRRYQDGDPAAYPIVAELLKQAAKR